MTGFGLWLSNILDREIKSERELCGSKFTVPIIYMLLCSKYNYHHAFGITPSEIIVNN